MAWPKHIPSRCYYCGKVGARSWSIYGKAHKYCIPKDDRKPEKAISQHSIGGGE